MQQDIKPSLLEPGTVIAIRYAMYKHFAIVSDRISHGMPKLISLSYRTKGIHEEPWHVVAGKRRIETSLIKGSYPKEVVLSRARDCMNKNIKYELLTFNCEHFVRYAHGLPVESIQVKRAFYGAVLGATSCVLLPKLTVARFAMFAAAGAATSLKNSLHKL